MRTLKKRSIKAISLMLTVSFLMAVFMPLTAYAETTYAINCVAFNATDSEIAGTVYVETDIDSYNGSAAFGEATENTDVTINAVANEGYEFVEWRKSAPASPEATFSTNANHTFTATETVWLYAIFQKIPTEYTLTFDANGGTGTMEPLTGAKSYTLPECTFTAPAGMQFAGWNVFGYLQDTGTTVNLINNATAYAVWEDIPPKKIKSVTVDSEIEFVLGGVAPSNLSLVSVPVDAGYEAFAMGWYDNTADEWVGNTETFEAGHAYMFSIELRPLSGYEFAAQNEITATIDGKPAEVSKNGNNIMVRVVYGEVVAYTVTFDAGEGSGTMDADVAEGAYTLPQNGFTAPVDKTFDKWSVEGIGDKNEGDTIIVNSDIVVTALWKDVVKTYTVTFHANGGTGTMADATEVVDEYTLPECTFTAPEGKRFKAWAYGDVGGPQKKPGDTITVIGDTDIYALWEDVPFEITSVTATISGVVGGATVSSATVTTDDTTYTVSIKNWYDCDNVFEYASADILQATDTFVEGKTYTVGVIFTPVGTNVLANDLPASINGESGKIGGYDSGSRIFFITITAVHTCYIEPVQKIKPTCTEGGKEAYYKCEGCGTFYEDALGAKEIADLAAWGNISALDHDFADATCTEPKTCKRQDCGATEGKALDHSFTDYKSDNNATCTEDGTKTAVCDRENCEEKDTVNDKGSAKGHTEVVDKAVAATCDTAGLTEGSHCDVCKIVLKAQTAVKAPGHSTTIVNKKAATYFAKGYSGDTVCKVCNKVIKTGKAIAKKTLKKPKVKVTKGKKQFKVKYTKVKGATGFEVWYKKGKKTLKATFNTKKTVTKAVKKLKKGSYKVKVRAFVKSGKKKAYSKWTKTYTAKVK